MQFNPIPISRFDDAVLDNKLMSVLVHWLFYLLQEVDSVGKLETSRSWVSSLGAFVFFFVCPDFLKVKRTLKLKLKKI